jgi:hypothetical protein
MVDFGAFPIWQRVSDSRLKNRANLLESQHAVNSTASNHPHVALNDRSARPLLLRRCPELVSTAEARLHRTEPFAPFEAASDPVEPRPPPAIGKAMLQHPEQTRPS